MIKKTTISSMLLAIRIALLALIVTSLVLDIKYLFGVLFVVVEILEVCDVVLAMRKPADFSRLGLVSNIIARLLYITPLLFLSIHKCITVWILLILIFFEIVIGLYKTFANVFGKKRMIFDILYCLYSFAIWVAIFVNVFLHKIGTVFIFVSSAIGAILIIYSSIIVGEDSDDVEDVVEEEQRSEIEKTITEEESDQIFE